MFSSITMASSTTRPMASTSASSVSVLIEKPASCISAKAPIRLTGMVTMGMIDARTVRRKTKITSATSAIASTMVWYTLFTARSMNTELSLAMSIFTSGGMSSCRRGSMSRTPLDSSSGLAVVWRMTPAEIAGRPFRRTALRSSAAPSSTRPTSRRRTEKPPTVLITMSLNCAGVVRSVCETTENSRCCDSMRPAGSSRFWRRMASSTSCVVSL